VLTISVSNISSLLGIGEASERIELGRVELSVEEQTAGSLKLGRIQEAERWVVKRGRFEPTTVFGILRKKEN